MCFVFLAAPGWAEAYRLYMIQIQTVELPSLSQSLLLLCLTSLGLTLGCLVLFCLFVFVFYRRKLRAGLLVFKMSSKISSYFVHYLHPFSSHSLLPFTHPYSSVNLKGFTIVGWAGYFPQWAMRLHVSACGLGPWLCGGCCWSWFTRCCCWREGIWLFSFTFSPWPAAITTLSNASIWQTGERLMEEAHQTQLFGSVSVSYMVIWWDLVGAVIL